MDVPTPGGVIRPSKMKSQRSGICLATFLRVLPGNLGSRVLQQILNKKLITPADLTVSSSNPNQLASASPQQGIEYRYGDFTNLESLQKAFSGADVLLLVSHPSAGAKRIDLHKKAIEAARTAGVETVVYTSMMFGGETGLNSVVGVQQGHVHT